MIDITLRVVPPKTTAQTKRVSWRHGRPQFFKSDAGQAAEDTFLVLLNPFRPRLPLLEPISLAVSFTWPHLRSTPRRVRDQVVPKATRPDVDNLVKALADCLVKLRFIEDDGQICRLLIEKFHGPESEVGIRIQMAPYGAERTADVYTPIRQHEPSSAARAPRAGTRKTAASQRPGV